MTSESLLSEQPPVPWRIPIIDHLRGSAALLVFICHFCGFLSTLPFGEELVPLMEYGRHGVEMFFAISGFVVPFSMFHRGHSIRHSGSFLLKRMIRLEPPYIACLVFLILLNAVTHYRAGNSTPHLEVQMTVPQVMAHFGYLNALLGYRWLNLAFWTLAIEFQYYVFISVAYLGMSSTRPSLRVATLVGTALLGFTSSGSRLECPSLLPYWLPLFALGMTACSYLTRQLDRATACAVFATIVGVAITINGVIPTAFAIVPVILILALQSRQPTTLLQPLAWMGTISYSFYLLHSPIGMRAQSHAHSFMPNGSLGYIISVIAAFVASLFCSVVFYYLIEKPSQRWSKGIGAIRDASGSDDLQTCRLPAETTAIASIPQPLTTNLNL